MSRQPNILIFLSDQHRHDWMGCAGCDFVDTPNMDRLARSGVRFSNASCNAPLCGPSRMSLLTGRFSHRLGVYINEHTLDANTPTLAHMAARAGYETTLCGRMHFMGPDQRHGYQSRLVGDICTCYAGGPRTDYGQIKGAASASRHALAHAQPGVSPVLQYDQAVISACERYLDDRDDDRPLLLTVGTYGPHHPYTAPPEFYQRARAAMEGADEPTGHSEAPLHPWHVEKRQFEKSGPEGFDPERIREARANYAGMISYLDTMVGRVLDAAQRNLSGPTLVIYLSDHGDSVGDHGLVGKCNFYRSSTDVPLIFAPLLDGDDVGLGLPGRIFEHPVSLVDLMPTITEIVDGPPSPLVDGESLAPILAGREDQRDWARRPVFSELELLRQPPVRMVRRGDWKLVYYHGHRPVHLFNLAEDPDEQTNLAQEPAHAPLRDELLALVLRDWDPDAIAADVRRSMDDLQWIAQWGREVGLGKLELWDQPPFTHPSQAMDQT